jgi:hypothetical protein
VRHAAKRLVYKHALPYSLLLTDQERAQLKSSQQGEGDAGSGGGAVSGEGGETREGGAGRAGSVRAAGGESGEDGVWLSGLSDTATCAALLAWLQSLDLPAPHTVHWPACGGFAEMLFEGGGAAAACAHAIDGQVRGSADLA